MNAAAYTALESMYIEQCQYLGNVPDQDQFNAWIAKADRMMSAAVGQTVAVRLSRRDRGSAARATVRGRIRSVAPDHLRRDPRSAVIVWRVVLDNNRTVRITRLPS